MLRRVEHAGAETEATAVAWLVRAAETSDADPAGAGGLRALRPAERRALDGILASRPVPAWPEALLARPASLPPGTWHLHALQGALARARVAGPAPRSAVLARVRYHARWLLHLLDPKDAAHAPLVSVVVPFFAGEELLRRAVRSALIQTWPRVEVIVVDDGSQEAGAVETLATAGGPERPVRVVRQPNRGVASARNLGIRVAAGELVHFLDADDELDADALARKLEALCCIPDAEIVCSRYRSEGHNGLRGANSHVAPDFGKAHCPTRDLLRSALRRYPFHTSSVLAVRGLLLDGCLFDECLRVGSDKRLWFTLGLRGVKVAALRTPLGTRHFHPGSLTAGGEDPDLVRPAALLLNLADLLAEPARWPLVGALVRPMSNRAQWSSLDGDPGPAVEAARRALLEQVERLGRDGRVEGYCARLPLLVLERHLVERTAGRSGLGRRLGEPVAGALQRALAGAPGPTLADAALWSAVPEISDPANRPALDALLRAMDRPVLPRGIRAVLGRPVLSSQAALRLAKAWPEHPASARLRLWARSDGSTARFLAHRLRRAFGRRWSGWKKGL